MERSLLDYQILVKNVEKVNQVNIFFIFLLNDKALIFIWYVHGQIWMSFQKFKLQNLMLSPVLKILLIE